MTAGGAEDMCAHFADAGEHAQVAHWVRDQHAGEDEDENENEDGEW